MTQAGRRVFDLEVEGHKFDNLDLFVIGGNQRDVAFTVQVAKLVDDGIVSIKTTNGVNKAKLSGIEIRLQELHTGE